MHPVPPSSGLVVNEDSGDDPSSPSNIYFGLTTPGSGSGHESFNQTDQPPDDEQHGAPRAQDLEDEPRPIGRSATFGSLFGEPSTTQPSSHSQKREINLEFPPVFTWPVATRRQIDDSTKSSSAEKTDQGPRAKGIGQSSNEVTNVLNVQEETIKHVSSHINKQLLEAEGESGRIIYNEGTTMSYFDADKAVKHQWAVSLPALIATMGHTQEPVAVPPWEMTLREVVAGLCRLFNFFVPLAYPCEVGDKFWGAICDLITVIPRMCDKSKLLELTQRTRRHRMTEAFFIADIRRPENADLGDDTEAGILNEDHTYCRKCDRGQQYRTQSDALDHLFECHVKDSPEARSRMSSRTWWVMDFGQYLSFLCRKDGQRILRELKDHLMSLEKMAFQIQHGVSEDGKFDGDTYRIPSSLVNAFQHILMMVVSGAHMAKSAYAAREAYIDLDPPLSFLTSSESGKITHYGTEAEVSMGNAIRDIALMTYTDELSDVVTYETVGPSLVVALTMGDCYPCRDSQNNLVNLVHTYRDYVLRLQFKAGQHPHRRLLQDIYLVREELQIIRRISGDQRLALTNYRKVLDPSSFRITTQSRVSSFQLEKARLNALISKIDADSALIDGLLERLDSLATQTRNGVDVQQEDHGKAILVFTVVTVIFMPLSFVTSYLGMNTRDIRDMSHSQTLFWAISVPLTVGIIVSVMVLAFQAERIREVFDTRWGHYREWIPKQARTVQRDQSRGTDIGKYTELSTGIDWSGKESLLRRSRGLHIKTAADNTWYV
ncbi:hypothetical protein BJX61DRAFT_203959 [Aspergillus egyptiacus]|nr:hypothetical protein BJX61DRAFT_203959 [Aspergillus egyptiacus]